LEYSVGARLRVDGQIYDVVGKVEYRNLNDNCTWFEYRLISTANRKEKWLSYDSMYGEYSISEVTGSVSTNGYHEVDRGEEVVVRAWGDVDVEVGDRASFIEYEDSTEEKIISVENWDDGQEFSRGYYLDLHEIVQCTNNAGYQQSYNNRVVSTGGGSFKNASLVGIIVFLWIAVCFLFQFKDVFSFNSSIAKYLKKSSDYTYVTSITGTDSEKADVYSTTKSIDGATRDIIDAISGYTENVQQNTEDGDDSVAILTGKEYCLIYTSENQETLIQISSRKYVYTSDEEPYYADSYTSRYYRRYYYTKGYYGDCLDYGKYSSPYDTYTDGTVDSNGSDVYDDYSYSVRQASTTSRTSSGGGTSSGK